jgi:RHS repeat-associated protein
VVFGASSLAYDLNASGLVTASLSGDSISVTAIAPGANSQITGSCQSEYPQYFNCQNPSVSGISGGTGGLSSSPFVTNYTYDAGGRFTSVVQGAQTRTFSYDGLGRITSATNPESGTVTYSYTSGGALCSGDPSNVCQRTDARGVISKYTYNTANQVTSVAYTIPNGQNIPYSNVNYYYGQGGSAAYAIGRLTEMVDGSGQQNYSYDQLGRLTQDSATSHGNDNETYNVGYKYDAGGDVTQITYPSGRVVQYAYNNVGQLCEIAVTASGCSDSTYYANIPVSRIVAANGYDDAGHLINFTYGNGVKAAYNYSPTRSQLTSLTYAKGSSTYFGLQYSYQQSSPYSPNCPTGTTGNNGSIECITDNVNSVRTSSYGYDSLDRLTSAANGNWGLAETYDRYGNRWAQTVTSGSGPSVSLTFGNNGLNGSTNNRPNGYTFDTSGNVTVEPTVPQQTYMTYDAENRMTALSGGEGAEYVYDGNGLRVFRAAYSLGVYRASVYWGSQVIAEYDNDNEDPSTPAVEYIYNPAGGATTGLLAMISNGATTYYHQDHLSVRLTTDANGNVVTQEGHFPFGELWYQSGPTNKWFFTGKERDAESGNDYFGARYYASSMGRFMSPDPSGLDYADPTNPQSLNLYSYALNNPLKNTDPTGLYCYYGDPDNNADYFDPSQYDFHSSESECTTPDENGNSGQWINDAGTHQDENGDWVDNDDRSSSYMMSTNAIGFTNDAANALSNTLSEAGFTGNENYLLSQDPDLQLLTNPTNPLPTLLNMSLCTAGQCAAGLKAQNNGSEQSLMKKIKIAGKWYLCGTGAGDNIMNYTLEGTSKGALAGAYVGIRGGHDGVGLGALAGGVEGFFTGAYVGTVAAGACQAAGVYGANE